MAMAHIKKMELFDAIFPFHILPVGKTGDVATPCGHFSVFFPPMGNIAACWGYIGQHSLVQGGSRLKMLVLCAHRESGNGITLGSKTEEFDDEAK